jgi:hypothetical protein
MSETGEEMIERITARARARRREREAMTRLELTPLQKAVAIAALKAWADRAGYPQTPDDPDHTFADASLNLACACDAVIKVIVGAAPGDLDGEECDALASRAERLAWRWAWAAFPDPDDFQAEQPAPAERAALARLFADPISIAQRDAETARQRERAERIERAAQ